MSQQMTEQKESGNGVFPAGVIAQDVELLSAPGNGVWFFFPRNARAISILLDSSGDGRIEFTNSSYANIVADTVPANEIGVWPHGDIGIAKLDALLNAANAFRQVNISGNTTMSAAAIG